MNNKNELYNEVSSEPSLIFSYIKLGNYELAYDLVNKNIVNINTVDFLGNDVVTRFLKAKQYEYVIQLMKKKNWNVNNQNDEGNTFGHILAMDNSPMALKVVEALTKKSNYIPNLKNKKHETALDIALNNNYLCTAFKLLEDKRFNDIDFLSFRNLFMASIENKYYGKYSKITNLEIIVESLEKKELDSTMKELIDNISDNLDKIKNDIMNNRNYTIESIISNYA
jgi:ankyrin repeat protein